jgi:hypothetical protein
VRDYFDGFRWHFGPFLFVTQNKIITKIEGPLSRKQLDLVKTQASTYKGKLYLYPELDLIPGLIDSHTHLSLEDKSFDAFFDPAITQMFHENDKSLAMAHKRLDQAIRRGFLFIRDLGGNPLVLQNIAEMVRRDPHRYPELYYLRIAFAAGRGQCPPAINCKKAFKKLPLKPHDINNYFKDRAANLHHKIFLDNDPYPGVLKKSHVTSLLREAKKRRAPLAIHTIKQEDFSWITPFLYPELSLEHLKSFSFDSIKNQVQSFLSSKVRLVPSLYSKAYMQLIDQRGKMPAHWPWERARQLKAINSMAKLSPLLCFGSDFYFPTFSPLRDWAFYAIEILRDFEKETFLKSDQVLSMATGGCQSLFPGTSAGLIKLGATASFNLVGGDLKSDLKYLHDIQGVIHRGQPYRLP